MTEIPLPLVKGALSLLLVVPVVALLVRQVQRPKRRKRPASRRPCAATKAITVNAAPEDAALVNLEAHLLSVFDFALFNAGYGHKRAWVMLRRAVKDIFFSLGDADASPAQAKARQFVLDLGKKYGLLVWAFDRHTPDEDKQLSAFVAAYAPQPWQGLLSKEPRLAMDCYHALPAQTGMAFWVVAKTGILMAQQENDRLAEGLLWGAVADLALLHYNTLGPEARHALDRLLACGNEVLLVTPRGFSAIEGPLAKLRYLLRKLKGEPHLELRRFVGQLEQAYGEQFKAKYGRDLLAA